MCSHSCLSGWCCTRPRSDVAHQIVDPALPLTSAISLSVAALFLDLEKADRAVRDAVMGYSSHAGALISEMSRVISRGSADQVQRSTEPDAISEASTQKTEAQQSRTLRVDVACMNVCFEEESSDTIISCFYACIGLLVRLNEGAVRLRVFRDVTGVVVAVGEDCDLM